MVYILYTVVDEAAKVAKGDGAEPPKD